MMRILLRAVALVAVSATTTSCATEIVGPLDTTSPDATTTTAPAPLPDGIVALLDELVVLATGLGDAVAEGEKDEARRRLARAEEIWARIQPLIVESGIDLLDETGAVVGLVRTAVQRTRPADGDKALRFAVELRDSAAALL
ncbi:MAG: hypothetical protein RL330_132 [Actinomycetota bacterium]|jgi:hypothetical protein